MTPRFMNKIVPLFLFFAAIFWLVFLGIEGAEFTYCRAFNREVAICESDHWHSDHCYQVFKQQQNDDCKE